jgi:hypothetical protein
MKAISNGKYEHLYGSLEELECLLTELTTKCEFIAEVGRKRRELEEQYKHYQKLLGQIARVAKGYEELATDIKLNLLGKQLKELQKTVKPDCPGYPQLELSIQHLYGT